MLSYEINVFSLISVSFLHLYDFRSVPEKDLSDHTLKTMQNSETIYTIIPCDNMKLPTSPCLLQTPRIFLTLVTIILLVPSWSSSFALACEL